jgi:hypothetical protein
MSRIVRGLELGVTRLAGCLLLLDHGKPGRFGFGGMSRTIALA